MFSFHHRYYVLRSYVVDSMSTPSEAELFSQANLLRVQVRESLHHIFVTAGRKNEINITSVTWSPQTQIPLLFGLRAFQLLFLVVAVRCCHQKFAANVVAGPFAVQTLIWTKKQCNSFFLLHHNLSCDSNCFSRFSFAFDKSSLASSTTST